MIWPISKPVNYLKTVKDIIKLENIQKVFRTEEVETVALGGVSFEVKKGEFVAIMGPSGCGKSTLLNILGLLDNPTSGTYLLDGENVGQLKESQRTRVRKGQIGFVFQSFNLIDELNVEENVELLLGLPTSSFPCSPSSSRAGALLLRIRLTTLRQNRAALTIEMGEIYTILGRFRPKYLFVSIVYCIFASS